MSAEVAACYQTHTAAILLPHAYHQPFPPTKFDSLTLGADALRADLTLFEYAAGSGKDVNSLAGQVEVVLLLTSGLVSVQARKAIRPLHPAESS